jgi:hypothetical protein
LEAFGGVANWVQDARAFTERPLLDGIGDLVCWIG